jgi:hypothetical protein
VKSWGRVPVWRAWLITSLTFVGCSWTSHAPKRSSTLPCVEVAILKLVFSYAFARALLGDEAHDDPEGSLPDWQYHLRELAALGVEDEQLAYLAGYLRR